jgi:hypothetical protein
MKMSHLLLEPLETSWYLRLWTHRSKETSQNKTLNEHQQSIRSHCYDPNCLSTVTWSCIINVITTHHCDLYTLVCWTSLHIHRQTHWLQVIYKSLLGKAPPYLSSLVTITTPTRSTRSSRYISLVIPNTSFGRLSFQFSAANDQSELQKNCAEVGDLDLPH